MTPEERIEVIALLAWCESFMEMLDDDGYISEAVKTSAQRDMQSVRRMLL